MKDSSNTSDALGPEDLDKEILGLKAKIDNVSKNNQTYKLQQYLELLEERMSDYKTLLKHTLEHSSLVEAELLDKENKVKEQAQLLDNAKDSIFIVDKKGVITYLNKSSENLYGWQKDDVLGKKKIFDFLTKEDVKVAKMAIKSVQMLGDWNGELCHRLPSGEIVTVESKWTQLDSTRYDESSVLIINTNISEKKALEEQFFRAQRLESIGQLASGIAHDLNNILSPFFLAIRALQPKLKDDSGQQILKLMEASANRGSQLVKQILSYAKGNEEEKSVINVLDLVKEIETMATETFPKNIDFKKEVPDSMYQVLGDSTQIHQVLLNLCVNARDAMVEGGELFVRISNHSFTKDTRLFNQTIPKGTYLKIDCVDTGIGMPADVLAHMFQPFFTTKSKGKGTGLGMSTVATILKKHNGYIEVQTEEGSGTSVTIYLPAVNDKSFSNTTAQTTLPFGNGDIILFVDDDPSIRQIGKAMLETYGYKVLSASNGKYLLQRHKKSIPLAKVMVCDMEMPLMDGPDTVKHIRKLNPDIKIIGMSGQSLETVKVMKKKRKLFYNEFLFKPYTSELLLEKIKDLIVEDI